MLFFDFCANAGEKERKKRAEQDEQDVQGKLRDFSIKGRENHHCGCGDDTEDAVRNDGVMLFIRCTDGL